MIRLRGSQLYFVNTDVNLYIFGFTNHFYMYCKYIFIILCCILCISLLISIIIKLYYNELFTHKNIYTLCNKLSTIQIISSKTNYPYNKITSCENHYQQDNQYCIIEIYNNDYLVGNDVCNDVCNDVGNDVGNDKNVTSKLKMRKCIKV